MKPEELAQGYDTTITFDNTTHPGEEKPKRIDIEHLFSEDTQKWLMEKWEKLGFEEEPIQKKVEHVFKYVE
jgi:hypothetical protein